VKVVVLTGAGISAESGVPTFRDADGLWEGHRVEDVATPEAFDLQPSVVHRFDDLLVVTQNIDDLHERGGSRRVLHMHGELLSALCRACGGRSPWEHELSDYPPCPRCGVSELRPDVVWFGEIPYQMNRIQDALGTADLFVSIGTSGAVYPAAGFVQYAGRAGARTLELNLVPSEGTHLFDQARHGPASELVPVWVDELLG
jgi:NAD-dependent deacetylase